jgi:hypothetical protein
MSCWPALSWPSCNPDPSAAPPIYECGDSRTAGQECCLSLQTTNKGVSNCPAGWASSPEQDEWCTDVQGIIHNSEYRHKCHRVLSCPNAAQDPATSCKTCKEPKYAYPECSSIKCANPKLLAPECSVCATYDKLAPPECDKCLDVSESLCGIPGVKGGQTCVDTRYDEFNCGGCFKGKGVECAPGEICNDGSCTCGVKFGIVYAEVQGQDSREQNPRQPEQDSNKFLIKLHWTSPEQFGVQLKVVVPDSDLPIFIIISETNTTQNPPGVFETTFALDKPRSSPVVYTIELRREGAVSSVELKVDFPNYASDNLNCREPGIACVPERKCVEGECIIPCPQGKSVCVNPQNDENVCVDFQNDVLNCGSCGRACVSPGPPTCVSGDCQCPEKDLYCLCRYEGERKPDEQCVFGKIDNATYDSGSKRITITYSLSMPVLPYFVASVSCLNIDDRKDKSTFDVRQGLKQQVTLQCVDEAGLGWVPDACFLIVSNLSSKEKYISTGCPRPGFGACGSNFEVALEPLTDIRYGFDFRFYRQLFEGKCTDLSSSLDNCGGCGDFCPVNQVCANFRCVDGCRGSNPASPDSIVVDGVPKCVFAMVRSATNLTKVAANTFRALLVYDADVPEGLLYYFQLEAGAQTARSQLFAAETAATRKTETVTFSGSLSIIGNPNKIYVLIKVPRPGQPDMDYRSELTEVQIL